MEKLEKLLNNIYIVGGVIVVASLALYTFKIIETMHLKAIIFTLVFISKSLEAFILHKSKRKIGAGLILMIVGSLILSVANLVEIFSKQF